LKIKEYKPGVSVFSVNKGAIKNMLCHLFIAQWYFCTDSKKNVTPDISSLSVICPWKKQAN